jgi:hypothetical protein
MSMTIITPAGAGTNTTTMIPTAETAEAITGATTAITHESTVTRYGMCRSAEEFLKINVI